VSEFERCITGGGVALFPSDTVYGLACDPLNAAAIARLYELKGRPPQKAAAVMFFDLDAALESLRSLGSLGDRTREALSRLLPGGVTVLLGNPDGLFPLACGDDPSTLGLRVISVPSLAGVRTPVLQSSANLAGQADARRLDEVPESIRAGADLLIDGGELPGTPSTVVDLRHFETGGIDAVRVLRHGAVSDEQVGQALAGQFHFNPSTYIEMIHDDIPVYDTFQDELALASGTGARRILELGTGTGETTRRLLAAHPEASLVAVDESEAMLAAAREALPERRTEFAVGRLQDALPRGPFDLVASALCVHHLDGAEKADLFARVRDVLIPGGRFALADVVVPENPADASTELTPGYDRPSTVADQLRWLGEAGFARASVAWSSGDLAVIVADATG
jgi:tRNA threonylcarbamoyl adenosine modification protein (Sua5/YciO/YrdC/YwlC family)